MSCPFCKVPSELVVASGDLVLAVRDLHPVSEGHLLIVPKRHVADYFALTDEERAQMGSMLLEMKLALDSRLSPDGYNVGVNVGRAAGQTIDHVHMHLIPRFAGDMEDPSGGIRGAIPEKRRYPRGDDQG